MPLFVDFLGVDLVDFPPPLCFPFDDLLPPPLAAPFPASTAPTTAPVAAPDNAPFTTSVATSTIASKMPVPEDFEEDFFDVDLLPEPADFLEPLDLAELLDLTELPDLDEPEDLLDEPADLPEPDDLLKEPDEFFVFFAAEDLPDPDFLPADDDLADVEDAEVFLVGGEVFAAPADDDDLLVADLLPVDAFLLLLLVEAAEFLFVAVLLPFESFAVFAPADLVVSFFDFVVAIHFLLKD